MILPRKHLTMDESIFGFGAFLLNNMPEKITVDELWRKYLAAYDKNTYPVVFSFDRFVLTLDFLFIIGALNMNEKGELVRATH